jgi:hypothetical protein
MSGLLKLLNSFLYRESRSKMQYSRMSIVGIPIVRVPFRPSRCAAVKVVSVLVTDTDHTWYRTGKCVSLCTHVSFRHDATSVF